MNNSSAVRRVQATSAPRRFVPRCALLLAVFFQVAFLFPAHAAPNPQAAPDAAAIVLRDGKRVVITDPKEIRGVVLLSVNQRGATGRQWMYIPATDRVRSVAPQERSERFVGSDFTYEDIAEDPLDEPPGTRAGSSGFTGVPYHGLIPVTPRASSCR